MQHDTSITGIDDLDIIIFDYLKEYDLYSICHTNDSIYQLCMNTPQLKSKYLRYKNTIQNTKAILNKLSISKKIKLLVKNQLKISYFKSGTKFDATVVELDVIKKNDDYDILIYFGHKPYYTVYHCDIVELVDILNDLFFRDIIDIRV